MSPVLARRRAGLLLHPTSLPGPGATGTLGEDALRFVDFLRAGGFSVWQTLPLGPVDACGSPYSSRSAHAGDTRLVDARRLRALSELPGGMDFDAVRLPGSDAYRSFCAAARPEHVRGFARFMRRRRRWLLPYGLFEVCAARFGGDPWWLWPRAFRQRELPALLAGLDREQFRATAFKQYLFELQWSALKRYANERGIYLFGDLPFYADLDSVEVWWSRSLFRLDAESRAEVVAGVPPDYFNTDGQLWGNPLYDWDEMRRRRFDWWVERLRMQAKRFDLIRLDHFRALESYWEVPAGASSAREGRWRRAPGAALLTALRDRLGGLPIVAEDLGIITDEVRELRDRFGLPGMSVLQFAFDGSPDNPYLPENHRVNTVVYTGTHDNDTTVGWYAGLDDDMRRRVRESLGLERVAVPDFLIDVAYASRALLAVIPMQDLLGLDSKSRMNTPGTTEGNWAWRFAWDEVDPSVAARSLQRARRDGRLADSRVG